MLKKIRSNQLEKGMYIAKVDRPWMKHPLFRTRITSKKQIEELIEAGVREVYIDTERGIDVTPKTEEGPPEEEELEEGEPAILTDLHHLRSEVKTANRLAAQATRLARDLLTDVRVGKTIEFEAVTTMVSELVDSIFRDDRALICLSKLKTYDEYTFNHCVNVSTMLMAFAKHVGWERENVALVGIGGILHDLGKMKVPAEVLNKPGTLTNEEFQIMKKHPELGADVLRNMEGIDEKTISITLEHHERFNGQGYPRGLRQEEVSLEGAMASIVDVYDALTSQRVYKAGMLPSEALKWIREERGQHFDSSLVDGFVECLGIYPIGSLVLLDTEEVGIVISVNPNDLFRPLVKALFNSKGKRVRPKVMDLTAKRYYSNKFRRSIIRSVDPQEYGIDDLTLYL